MGERSIREYLFLLKKKIWLIIIFTIVPLVIGGITGTYDNKIEPEYKAYTAIIVGGPETYLDNIDTLDHETYAAINGRIVSSFNELTKVEIVGEEVIKNLKLDMSYKELADKTEISLVEDTEMIKIEVIDKDPELATSIVNEIIAVSSKKAKELMGIENVQAVGKVQIKAIPLKTERRNNMGIAGVLGFSASILLILLMEFTDKTIKTPKDIEKYFNLPVTGIVERTDEGLWLPGESNSLARENYRTLATNIISMQKEKNIKSILVTPFTPSRNGNLISTNLAIGMAEVGRKVLLIDGDLRKPEIHGYFAISNEIGLSNVLKDDVNYNDGIKKVKTVDGLDLLVSGPKVSDPVKLLASNGVEELLEQLNNKYDIIIINSPSLGTMTDATLLSTVVDGTIAVCTARKTKIQEIELGKELMNNIGSEISGVVLNGVDLKDNLYYNYFYESYNYYK